MAPTPITILGTDSSWLEKDPRLWSEDKEYREMEDFVRQVKVTNDVAERGCGIITEYSQILTKDDNRRGKLLQGVEISRKINPDFTQ